MKFCTRAGCELALMIAAVTGPALSTPTAAATAPYPRSRLITAMTWDLSTVSSLRQAQGSDLWPLAWAADGNLYGAWGDGGGFDGDSNNIGRVSLGFARITGSPVAGERGSYSGKNVWGDAPLYAESKAFFGGKIDDLIAVDGVLYGHGGLWTAANCNCSNPILKPQDNPRQRTVVWSADLGRTWQLAPWTSHADAGASLQYGQNYAGALDPDHVYFYYQRDVNGDAAHIYLRRILKTNLTADPATPGIFEYLSRLEEHGAPSWSNSEADGLPIFFDPAVPSGSHAGASVIYDAELGRYLLTAFHGEATGQIGFFEAPAPWGPWATVAYYDDWGGFNETAGTGNGLTFPVKWIGDGGKVLWAVFSGVTNGFDSFNIAKAVLTVSRSVPQFTSPAAGTVLSPGERVTYHGMGTDLTWSVDRLQDGQKPLATGTGSVFTFVTPNNIASDTTLRVTLAGPEASVYRDYVVEPSSRQTEVGYWSFNEGRGTVAADDSDNGNPGTLLNGVLWAAGEVGDALNFEGGRTAVVIRGSGSLANLYRRGLTVTAWIKPRSEGASGRVVDKDGNVAGWFLKMDGSRLQFVADQFSDAAVIRNAARTLALNTWQRIAVTWDGSTRGSNVHLYLNGSLIDGNFVDGEGSAADDSAVLLTIGNRAADLRRGFDGIIDEVHIYDRVLSADEVRER